MFMHVTALMLPLLRKFKIYYYITVFYRVKGRIPVSHVDFRSFYGAFCFLSVRPRDAAREDPARPGRRHRLHDVRSSRGGRSPGDILMR